MVTLAERLHRRSKVNCNRVSLIKQFYSKRKKEKEKIVGQNFRGIRKIESRIFRSKEEEEESISNLASKFILQWLTVNLGDKIESKFIIEDRWRRL